MDQFTAGLALDPAAVGEEVHEAQECNGDSEREDGSDVGVHEGFLN